MPSLLPQTVNPALNLEQFTILIEVGKQTKATPMCSFRELRMSCVHFPSVRPSAGAAGDAGPHRPTAAKQVEVGQPLDSLATPPAVAPPVLLGQYARAPVQHSQPANRSAEDVQCRGHGAQEFHRIGRYGRLVVRWLALVAGQQLLARGKRVPQSTSVGQHADDSQDPNSSVVCFVAGWYARQWSSDPKALEHRTAGEAQLGHESVAAHGEYFAKIWSIVRVTLKRQSVREQVSSFPGGQPRSPLDLSTLLLRTLLLAVITALVIKLSGFIISSGSPVHGKVNN